MTSKYLRLAIAGGFLFFGGIAGVVTGRWQTVVSVLVGSAVTAVLLKILYRYTDQDGDNRRTRRRHTPVQLGLCALRSLVAHAEPLLVEARATARQARPRAGLDVAEGLRDVLVGVVAALLAGQTSLRF